MIEPTAADHPAGRAHAWQSPYTGRSLAIAAASTCIAAQAGAGGGRRVTYVRASGIHQSLQGWRSHGNASPKTPRQAFFYPDLRGIQNGAGPSGAIRKDGRSPTDKSATSAGQPQGHVFTAPPADNPPSISTSQRRADRPNRAAKVTSPLGRQVPTATSHLF